MKLNNISWPQKNICDLQRKKLTGTDIMTAMENRIKPTSHHQKQITNPNKTCKEQDKQRTRLTTWTLKTDTRKNAGEGGKVEGDREEGDCKTSHTHHSAAQTRQREPLIHSKLGQPEGTNMLCSFKQLDTMS